MDVHTTIYSLLHTSGGVSVWDKEKLTQLKSQQQGQKFTHMSNIIDQLGVLSAKAQALPKPITSSSKLLYSDSRLFLFSEGGKTIGMLKTGPKKLFYRVCIVLILRCEYLTSSNYCVLTLVYNDIFSSPE